MSKAVEDVLAQAAWQRDRYGEMNETMPDGTGPDAEWLAPIVDETLTRIGKGGYREVHLTAKDIEALLRDEWDYPAHGTPEAQDKAAATCSWLRILREEVAEAFGAEDRARLRAELVQVSAVALNWVETIDRRDGDGTA